MLPWWRRLAYSFISILVAGCPTLVALLATGWETAAATREPASSKVLGTGRPHKNAQCPPPNESMPTALKLPAGTRQ